MSVKLYLGKPGSGKTASAVYDMIHNNTGKKMFTNIMTKGIKNNTLITTDMIIKRTTKPGKTEKSKPVVMLKCNMDYWIQQREEHKALDVVVDEAHTILNSRRSTSKINNAATDWLALIRRMLGSSDSGSGELTLISQFNGRLDTIARQSATQIRWYIMHYTKYCTNKKCIYRKFETNETTFQSFYCPRCESALKKLDFWTECYVFADTGKFELWYETKQRSYVCRLVNTKIAEVFSHYDTLQINDMLSKDFEEE